MTLRGTAPHSEQTGSNIRQDTLELCAAMGFRHKHLTASVVPTTFQSSLLIALLNYRATANFISAKLVEKYNLWPEDLPAPVVRGIKGEVLAEVMELGYYRVGTKLRSICDTSIFCVLNTNDYNLILGLLWVEPNNPGIK